MPSAGTSPLVLTSTHSVPLVTEKTYYLNRLNAQEGVTLVTLPKVWRGTHNMLVPFEGEWAMIVLKESKLLKPRAVEKVSTSLKAF